MEEEQNEPPVPDWWQAIDEDASSSHGPHPGRRGVVIQIVAAIALLAFIVAFPLSTLVDGFSRGSYPELGLAAIEVVFVGALVWWLRSRRGRDT